jgi:predicted DNA-binding protein (MmcQ/YjbR family)
MTMTAPTLKGVEKALRAQALAYPETIEDHPWGENVIKVRGKIFAFVNASASGLSLTMKLPASSAFALAMPGASPTGYGLGKSGWVTFNLKKPGQVPLEALQGCLDESYRAVAPKKLVNGLRQFGS